MEARFTGVERRAKPRHEECVRCEQFEVEVLAQITDMERRINERLDKGSERMDCIDGKVDKAASAMTEVLEILTMGRSLFKLAGYVGDFLKWIVGVGAAVGAIWVSIKNGWWN